jgi:hypothetical protein
LSSAISICCTCSNTDSSAAIATSNTLYIRCSSSAAHCIQSA